MPGPFRIPPPPAPRDNLGRFRDRKPAVPAPEVIRRSNASGEEILTELDKGNVRAPDHEPIRPWPTPRPVDRQPFRVRRT